jgi:hypothetical protein
MLQFLDGCDWLRMYLCLLRMYLCLLHIYIYTYTYTYMQPDTEIHMHMYIGTYKHPVLIYIDISMYMDRITYI